MAGALRAFLDVSHIPERTPGGGLLADLREELARGREPPWLWSIVAQFSVVVAVVGAAEAVYGPLVARDALGGARPWGIALAAFGAGTIGGALLMLRWKPRRMLLVGTLCVFPLALPSAALAVPLQLPGLMAAMFVCGVTLEVFGVAWMTTLHQEIPEEKMSRVTAYDWFGSTAMLPLSTALAGPRRSSSGARRRCGSCAALIVLVTALVLLVPDVRNLTRRTRRSPRAERLRPLPSQPMPKAPPGGTGDATASASRTTGASPVRRASASPSSTRAGNGSPAARRASRAVSRGCATPPVRRCRSGGRAARRVRAISASSGRRLRRWPAASGGTGRRAVARFAA